MCARWNSDLGRVDRELFSNLQRLIGSELSFLCDYIGTAARLIATIVPTIPVISLHDFYPYLLIYARLEARQYNSA